MEFKVRGEKEKEKEIGIDDIEERINSTSDDDKKIMRKKRIRVMG